MTGLNGVMTGMNNGLLQGVKTGVAQGVNQGLSTGVNSSLFQTPAATPIPGVPPAFMPFVVPASQITSSFWQSQANINTGSIITSGIKGIYGPAGIAGMGAVAAPIAMSAVVPMIPGALSATIGGLPTGIYTPMAGKNPFAQSSK